MKYYAVKNGRKPGIYTTWDDCKKQVDGYAKAEFKSFKTLEDAKEFVGMRKQIETSPEEKPVIISKDVFETEKTIVMDIPIERRTDTLIAYVDGSNISDKKYGFGIVGIDHGIVLFEAYGTGQEDGMRTMRNVAGEILGAMEAVKYAKRHGYKLVKIYYDYKGIEMWVTGGYKAKNPYTQYYREFMNSQGIEIEFYKVKSHTGVEFNERADELAKMAVL